MVGLFFNVLSKEVILWGYILFQPEKKMANERTSRVTTNKMLIYQYHLPDFVRKRLFLCYCATNSLSVEFHPHQDVKTSYHMAKSFTGNRVQRSTCVATLLIGGNFSSFIPSEPRRGWFPKRSRSTHFDSFGCFRVPSTLLGELCSFVLSSPWTFESGTVV